MRTLEFKTSFYFSTPIRIAAVVLDVAAFFLVISNPFVALGLMIISIAIFSTQYRLVIDFENKMFHDYVWILGVKSGEKEKFQTIEYIFIKKSKVSQTMSVRVASTTIHKDVYNGYLKFSEQQKLHLLTNNNKDYLIKKLKPMADNLGIRLIDYSEAVSREI